MPETPGAPEKEGFERFIKEADRPACPTYFVKLTDNFVAMTMLEDEAPHLDVRGGGRSNIFGELSRADQEEIISQPGFPADEGENIRKHWRTWDEYARKDEDGKFHGVKLVPGGREAVDRFAEEWRAKHPGGKARRAGGARGRRKGGRGGDQRSTILMFSMRPPSKLEDPSSAYIGWTDEEKAAAEAALDPAGGDARPLAEIFFSKVGDGDDCEVADCYAIRHDRDMHPPIWDSETEKYILDAPKDPHLHVYIRFKGRESGLTAAGLAKRLGIPESQVEKGKTRGRYAWSTQCAYAIHALDGDDNPEKHHYEPEDVITLKGKPYPEVYSENKFSWERKRAQNVESSAVDEQSLSALRAGIADGTISREDIMLNEEYFRAYATPKGRASVECAFQARSERRMYLAARALRKGEFTKTVVYVQGAAGTGKTEMAHGWCDFLEARFGWDTYRAAAKNALDDYAGEEVMLLDDVRAQAMTAEDWLKLLDPYHASPASARYRNKASIAPRAIIITCSKPPEEFFCACAARADGGNANEAMDQFFRRLLWRLLVFDPSTYGYYNIEASHPKLAAHPAKVSLEITKPNGDFEILDFENLNHTLNPAPGMLSPYAATEGVIRDVAVKSSGKGLSEDEASELCAEAARYVHRRFLKLMDSGAIPSLPGPDEGCALELPEATASRPTRHGLPDGPPVPRAAEGDGGEEP